MMQRRVILGVLPQRRVQLTAEALARVADAPVQATLFDEAVTEWVCDARRPPPMTGWWDYQIVGTAETGRLWFQQGNTQAQRDIIAEIHFQGDGVWCNAKADGTVGKGIGWHHAVGGTLRWRGLQQPAAEGYGYNLGERY